MSGVRTQTPRTVATFLGTAALLVAYATDGGTYDIVARQQAGLLIWWALFLVAALGLLPKRRPGAPIAVAMLALAGLALWAAVSLSWSESDERTLAEVARTLHHLGLLALIIVLAGRERWVAVVGGATLGAVVVSGLSLGIRLDPDLFGTDATARAFHTNRLSSPLGYWNAVGAWSAMTTPLLLAWSAHARTAAVRACALAALPAVLVVLYLTYSRAGLADLAVALVLVVGFSARRWTTALHAVAGLALGGVAIVSVRAHPQIANFTGTEGRGTLGIVLIAAALAGAAVALATRRLGLDNTRMTRKTARGVLVLGGVVASAALVVAAFTVLPSAWREFKRPAVVTGGGPTQRLTNLNGSRYQIYSSAVTTFRSRPLLGSGAGTFEFTYDRGGGVEYVRDAHSLLLEPFTELGVVGGLLVLVFLGAIVATFVSARRRVASNERATGAIAGAAAAGGAYIVAASVDWMWEVTAVSALFLVLAGAAGAVTLRDAPAVGRPARFALALAALIAVAVMVPGMRATLQIRDSQRAAGSGNLPAAVTAALAAQKSAPWAATPYFQLGLVEEQAGRFADARAQLLAARQREPTNWRIPFVLSRVDAELNDAPGALRAYREARTLRPAGALFSALDQAASSPSP